jgi:hypothetical protein
LKCTFSRGSLKKAYMRRFIRKCLIINLITIIILIMSETTTIQISTDTRNELRTIGKMGDNYEKVIRKLIKEHKEHKYKLKIDKLAKEADDFIKEHRDEFVSIDEL